MACNDDKERKKKKKKKKKNKHGKKKNIVKKDMVCKQLQNWKKYMSLLLMFSYW